MRLTSRRGGSRSRASLPPGVEADGTRLRILEVALRMFSTRGFHGTSVRDLAGVLKLQPSALYAHFPSKDHVLAELCRVGHEAHLKAMRAALLEAGSDPAEQLRALVREHSRLHAAFPELAIVVNDEVHALPKELAGAAFSLRSQAASLLVEVVERGVAMRRFQVPDVLTTSSAIAAMGLRIPYWFTHGSGQSLEVLLQSHVTLALRMVGAAEREKR